MSAAPRGFETDRPLETLRRRLRRLYGEAGEATGDQVLQRLETARQRIAETGAVARPWDQSDAVLIAYADQLRRPGQTHLQTLAQFADEQHWRDLLTTVHLLPFFPYSSDDGFSVIDYLQVDPEIGCWEDVERLGDQFRLMFDWVLNHASSQSKWFQDYLQGQTPFDRFFVEADPADDLDAVVRPRSTPLLTPFETSRGVRQVWTTFSADQVDLNYAAPEVLLAMLDVLLEYVVRGAQIVRLDAIAFLWKKIGTSCLHLPETHEFVKLVRDVLTLASPHVWLLTETNVPHAENVSYFGDGDEAHLVYQFALPPLLLDAFVHRDATYLTQWLAQLEPAPVGATYFNFTASHDGVGVRPIEGILPQHRFDGLIDAMRQRGALISTRRRGSEDLPYEINLSYVDALAPDASVAGGDAVAGDLDVATHARRFLASQAVMLAMQGIPGVYVHSLLGSRSDFEAARQTGQPRRVNRRKFTWEAVHAQLQDDPLSAAIYKGYCRLLEIRRRVPAFHPAAEQHAYYAGTSELFVVMRKSLDGQQVVLAAANVSDNYLVWHANAKVRRDLISDEPLGRSRVEFAPDRCDG